VAIRTSSNAASAVGVLINLGGLSLASDFLVRANNERPVDSTFQHIFGLLSAYRYAFARVLALFASNNHKSEFSPDPVAAVS